jgi:hypothetical protein
VSEYYDASSDDPTLASLWDSYYFLPEPGDHLLFDDFCIRKGVSRTDLARIGTKMTKNGELAWLFPGGIKYRDLGGNRRTSQGAKLDRFKVVDTPGARLGWIIAEGETDAAALARACPDYGILIMPAGAKAVSDEMVDDVVTKYAPVYCALDADEAGDEGAAKMPGLRMRPPEPHNDWAEALSVGAYAEPIDPVCFSTGPPRTVFSFREVLAADLGTYADNNWYDDGILPVRGTCIVHGEQKSLKSVVLMELIRGLSTGTDFAGYVGYLRDKPARVLLFQFEVPPHDFQLRVEGVALSNTSSPEDYAAFLDNAGAYMIANNVMPSLDATKDTFLDEVLRAADDFEADVLCFDPFQRMSGSANINQQNEIAAMLSRFHELNRRGFTVVMCHHSSKNLDPRKSTSITGSQRFGADVNSICTLYHKPELHLPDYNQDGIRQRNLLWTLRSGAVGERGVETRKDTLDPASHRMQVTFREPYTDNHDDVHTGAPDM